MHGIKTQKWLPGRDEIYVIAVPERFNWTCLLAALMNKELQDVSNNQSSLLINLFSFSYAFAFYRSLTECNTHFP